MVRGGDGIGVVGWEAGGGCEEGVDQEGVGDQEGREGEGVRDEMRSEVLMQLRKR